MNDNNYLGLSASVQLPAAVPAAAGFRAALRLHRLVPRRPPHPAAHEQLNFIQQKRDDNL